MVDKEPDSAIAGQRQNQRMKRSEGDKRIVGIFGLLIGTVVFFGIYVFTPFSRQTTPSLLDFFQSPYWEAVLMLVVIGFAADTVGDVLAFYFVTKCLFRRSVPATFWEALGEPTPRSVFRHGLELFFRAHILLIGVVPMVRDWLFPEADPVAGFILAYFVTRIIMYVITEILSNKAMN